MRVRYEGVSFGVDGLTNGKEYEVLEVDEDIGALRIIDDSGEDYLYNPNSPKPNGAKKAYGKFIIISDDNKNTLSRFIR